MVKMIYWIDGVKYDNITRVEMGEVLLRLKLYSAGLRYNEKGLYALKKIFDAKTKEEFKAISNLIINYFYIEHKRFGHQINSRYKQRLQFSIYKHLTK